MKSSWVDLFRPVQTQLDDIIHRTYARADDADADARPRCCPPRAVVFRCFSFFEVLETKVVIVGQDPYHTPGTATGLAFQSNHKSPPSLVNIFKAVRNTCPSSACDLEAWASQGVLMLNRALSVEENKPNSHTKLWKPVTDRMVQLLSKHAKEHDRKLVFMLWGNNAKELAPHIDHDFHIVLTHTHPSPLSRKPFDQCDHFAKCNETHYIQW